MKALIATVAWVMVNGFPVTSFDSCDAAERNAEKMRADRPELRIAAVCDAHKIPSTNPTIEYYGPQSGYQAEQ